MPKTPIRVKGAHSRALVGKEIAMNKIFVRQRRHAGQGARRPRFAIVASQGSGLHFLKTFVRRAELEKIASETGAEIIYLPRGEYTGEQASGGGKSRRRRQKDEE